MLSTGHFTKDSVMAEFKTGIQKFVHIKNRKLRFFGKSSECSKENLEVLRQMKQRSIHIDIRQL